MNNFFYRYIARPILCFFVKIILRPKVIGIKNIPNKGPFILAGNHTNILDSVLLVGLNKNVIHFLAKDSLMKGFKGYLFRMLAIIPVNRKIHDKKALKSGIEVLNNNEIIGIFPEGTVNKSDNVILPFKIGAVKMASETNCKIVPFVIKGSYNIFKHNLSIHFLNSISVSHNEDLTKDNEYLMDIISNELRR